MRLGGCRPTLIGRSADARRVVEHTWLPVCVDLISNGDHSAGCATRTETTPQVKGSLDREGRLPLPLCKEQEAFVPGEVNADGEGELRRVCQLRRRGTGDHRTYQRLLPRPVGNHLGGSSRWRELECVN